MPNFEGAKCIVALEARKECSNDRNLLNEFLFGAREHHRCPIDSPKMKPLDNLGSFPNLSFSETNEPKAGRMSISSLPQKQS